MATTFTLHTSRFPAGTTVGAYVATEGQPPSGAPASAAVTTAVVSASNVLAFTGLTAGVKYWAYASVSSEDRYVSFLVDADTAPEDVAAEATTRAAADVVLAAADTTDAAAWAAADKVRTANAQVADYTLVLADAGKSVDMNHATTALVLTVPPNASVAFPLGTIIEICRVGAGTVTITPGAAVTIPSILEAAGTTDRTITTRFGSARIRKRATNEWVLTGTIS